jgi:hypothetical protein
MNKYLKIVAGSLLLSSAIAQAEPVSLSGDQLDTISAGTYIYSGVGLATSGAGAAANLLGTTGSATLTDVSPTALIPHVVSGATSGALAVSTFNPLAGPLVNGASAISGASSSSALF